MILNTLNINDFTYANRIWIFIINIYENKKYTIDTNSKYKIIVKSNDNITTTY